MFEGCRRVASTFRAQAIPIENVVSNLRGIVEDGVSLRLPYGTLYNLLQLQVGIFCSRNQLVQVVHIGFVMFAVVETQCLGCKDRFQCVFGIWKWG